MLVWTTTPWTLPSNRAICVSSGFTYVVYEYKDQYIIFAKERLSEISTMLGQQQQQQQQQPQFVAELSGSDLIGLGYLAPFPTDKEVLDRSSPTSIDKIYTIMHGDHVTQDSGTGIVHTAPGHGFDDFLICKANGIPAYAPINDYGKYTADVGKELEGKFILSEGNQIIIEKLRESQLLVNVRKYFHRYPYDWRTKKPVIIRSTLQWFSSVSSIKDDTLNAIEQVTYHPSSGKERLSNMVKMRSDWCISRQRHWGVPIPTFYHKVTKQPLINQDTITHLQKLISEHPGGCDVWWELSEKELLPPKYADEADMYEKGKDTMDVWFDSGVSWNSVIKARHQDHQEEDGIDVPVDLYLEGSDQYRGWFQSSLLTSVSVTGKAPYKQVITHGFVLDHNGHKMSKSLGNVIDPHAVIDGGKIAGEVSAPLGVDVMRLWVASTDFTSDVNVSLVLLNDHAVLLRKIRNTIRYLLGNLNDFHPTNDAVDYNDLLEQDKYFLTLLHQYGEQVNEYYDTFAFNKVIKLVTSFTNQQLSAFYFDVLKDRMYTSPAKSLSRRSAQQVLHHVLEVYTKSLGPILCHLVEDVFVHYPPNYQKREGERSIYQSGWFKLDDQWNNKECYTRWELLRSTKPKFFSLYEQMKTSLPGEVKTTVDIDLVVQVLRDSPMHQSLESYGIHAGEIFNVSNFKFEVVDKIDNNESYSLKLSASKTPKCPRCWKKVTKEDNRFCNKEVCPL
eukprot:TRINITY_DN1966_c0_g2_i2.p1 TRINITY_DN1966_c0_g2~~TRINITY_DN1966_c0_g2_i2.p1  ORF type:complete len:728 (+),score=179.00 TRINITY_DN1966_c0_g2_i2:959-3142(+)